jgi:hypothetical protein
VQTEKYFMGAFGRVQVIDFNAVTIENSAHLPRRPRNVDDCTLVRQECLNRPLLETERRFCGNKSEEVSSVSVLCSDREMMASLLDPRTNHLAVLMKDAAYRTACTALLRAEYINFTRTARATSTANQAAEELSVRC